MAANITRTKKPFTLHAGTGSYKQVLHWFVYPKQMRCFMQGRVCGIRPQISHLDFGHAED